MAEVIGVRFKGAGKVYYFDPCGLTVELEQAVIVETARGIECGIVALANREVADHEIVKPLKRVIRPATKKDLAQMAENRRREANAFEICQKKIAEHGMDMKLVDVEFTFDNSKILFYFTADGRVDFRELVKDLAGIFRTRIELRQIGVRDEAKMLGGLGICGRVFCCTSFLGDFQPVSIRMAKEQGLSLNPTKISGTCGRLMCCLKYEQAAYEDLIRTTPKNGTQVITPEGRGTVTEVSLLTGMLKVRLDDGDGSTIKPFHKRDLRPDREEAPSREASRPAKKQEKKGASGGGRRAQPTNPTPD
jgi:cell fate regulator YaaT (PSP1 superfamily)